MKESSIFVKGCDLEPIDGYFSIKNLRIIPKIRRKAESLSERLKAKAEEIGSHEFDEEIKELQSILDELQHFGVVISFSTHQSTKNPYPSLNGATFNPGASSTDEEETSDKAL